MSKITKLKKGETYVYKAVRRTKTEGVFTSLVLGSPYLTKHHGRHGIVKYKLHEWATAPKWLAKQGYHPTVFVNLPAARDFLTYYKINEEPNCLVLFKAKARGGVPLMPRTTIVRILLGTFNSKNKYHAFEDAWPPGVAMYEEVMLLEEVNWEED